MMIRSLLVRQRKRKRDREVREVRGWDGGRGLRSGGLQLWIWPVGLGRK